MQERARGPLSPCQVWWGSEFHPPLWRPKTSLFVYLFVCLFVRHAFERQKLCARFRREGVGVQKRFLIPLDRGRFVVGTRVQLSQTAANWRHHWMPKSKNRKIWGFSPPEGDRINGSRRNLARKLTPSVCYSTRKLAVIGKRGLVQEPPKMSKFAQNCGFLATGSQDNDHIQMKFCR